ncbi:hypothetical protein ABVT39_012977 [Epinephelus coioides]
MYSELFSDSELFYGSCMYYHNLQVELFLTDELLQHIADQTNLYTSQYMQIHPDNLPYSRRNTWKTVSVPELKTFFGFLTGYVKKPNFELYWSMDKVDPTPYFSNNNASQDVTDRMYKVHPVLDSIVEKFREMYQPGQNICIDEAESQHQQSLDQRDTVGTSSLALELFPDKSDQTAEK